MTIKLSCVQFSESIRIPSREPLAFIDASKPDRRGKEIGLELDEEFGCVVITTDVEKQGPNGERITVPVRRYVPLLMVQFFELAPVAKPVAVAAGGKR